MCFPRPLSCFHNGPPDQRKVRRQAPAKTHKAAGAHVGHPPHRLRETQKMNGTNSTAYTTFAHLRLGLPPATPDGHERASPLPLSGWKNGS